MANAGNKSGGTAYKLKLSGRNTENLTHLRRERGRQCDRAVSQTTTQHLLPSNPDNLGQGPADQAGDGLGCQGARTHPNPEFRCSCFPPWSQLTGVIASCTEPRGSEKESRTRRAGSPKQPQVTTRKSVRTAHMQTNLKNAQQTLMQTRSGQTQSELLAPLSVLPAAT